MKFQFLFFLFFVFASLNGYSSPFGSENQDTVKQLGTVKPLPLTARDSAIYRMIDSMEQAKQREKALKLSEAAFSGNIPISIFNIDYRRIVNYNPFEGLRLGLGLATNQKLASFFSIGGYFSYGFKDMHWKYGSYLQLFPKWQSDTRLTLRYTKDIKESGGYSFFDDHVMGSNEWLRTLLIRQMDMTSEKEAAFSFRAFQYFKFNVYLTQTHKLSSLYSDPFNEFDFTEAGMSIKFAYHENFLKTPGGQVLSIGTNYPMVWFNLKRGLDFLNGNFEYTKYEMKIFKRFITKPFGRSQITVVAALADGSIPLTNLYNGHGSYGRFSITAENSFATMRMNEFYSNEFASLYFMQYFGKLVKNNPYFAPEICFATNVGYGKMKNLVPNLLNSYNTLEKGYYESGILVINVLKLGLMGYGVGVYYRYGPYTYSRIADNFGYKVALNIGL